MIKVYFKAGSFWTSCGCDCCEDTYFEALDFSHIEGVVQPTRFESYDYEMYNGSKSNEFDCLVSVFWDMIADKRQYDHFYDMCESFDDVDEDSVINMLSDKGIEVVFLEN